MTRTKIWKRWLDHDLYHDGLWEMDGILCEDMNRTTALDIYVSVCLRLRRCKLPLRSQFDA